MKSRDLDLVHFWGFCLWFLIGLFYPDRYLEVLTFNVGWEVFERLTLQFEVLNDVKRKYWILPEDYWNESELNQYADVILRMMAYVAGSKISSVLRGRSGFYWSKL
jgi:hypothetical protein